MRTVSHFVTHRLHLKVNEEKSHVTRPWEMCFLGFRITSMINFTRIQIHPKSIKRLKERVRQ
ncbi:group II intron reverse transcriptase/maturase, partial [Desulforhopalus vacuolatus]|nr:group II intron reverse transcriptase/maturase [Desulforhopalus vacuolatus]